MVATHQSPILTAALRAVGKGKPVFPCGQDKQPLTPHGFKDATTNPEQITTWWTEHPNALIGMPTGVVSGFTILDVDIDSTKGIDGNDSLFELEKKHSKIPDTPEAITPRGGRHIYFKYVPGIRNSAGKLGRGLDIRGDGGYAIIPPSGMNGHRYQWEGSNPKTFAQMPQWMVDLLSKRTEQPAATIQADSTNIPEGGRNQHMTSLAGSMRRRGMSVEAMEAALLAENTARCRPALNDDEVRVIARSVGRYDPAFANPANEARVVPSTTDGTTPQEIPFDQILAKLEPIIAETRENPGRPYKQDSVALLTQLKSQDQGEFIRARARIKHANRNTLLKELDKAISAAGPERDGNTLHIEIAMAVINAAGHGNLIYAHSFSGSGVAKAFGSALRTSLSASAFMSKPHRIN